MSNERVLSMTDLIHYSSPTLSEIADALDSRGIEYVVSRNSGSTDGQFIATSDCARVIGLASAWDEPSVIYCDPALLKTSQELDMGGAIGGERLWFAPETRFHWHGEPDWKNFSNYSPPVEVDPGNYFLSREADGTVVYRSDFTLADSPSNRTDRASVVKRVWFSSSRQKDGLLPMLCTYSLKFEIELTVAPSELKGVIGIWSIVQMPPGTNVSLPLDPSSDAMPIAYSPGQPWEPSKNVFEWTFRGIDQAKIGFAASQLRGRAYARSPAGLGPATAVVLTFPHAVDATYCDHPYGVPSDNQAFQVWDGFGFGELEMHSPLARAVVGENKTVLQYELQVIAGEAERLSEYIADQIR